MNNILTVETEQLFGGNMEGTLLSLDCKIKTIFCFMKRPCLLENVRDMLKKDL
jgi:hypothetical protein